MLTRTLLPTLLIAISALLPVQTINASPDALTKETNEGPVKGFHSKSNTLSWHGIPYAQSPVGKLRWQAPLPPLKREKVLIANNNDVMCPQIAGPLTTLNVLKWGEVVGQEDCLFLNITAPDNTSENKRLPVMVWIHGGGNSIGSKGNRAYTGEILSSQGQVIVVSINYRLGPLGWFFHPAIANQQESTAGKSGNFGTLDLIQALKWTQQNIHHFGGNPENITIFGESAGGYNTYSLLLSPSAKELFHRAIVQSGGFSVSSREFASVSSPQSSHNILKQILLNKNIAQDENQANHLLDNMPSEEVRELLHQVPAKDIIQLYPQRAAGMLEWPGPIGDGLVLPTRDIAYFENKGSYNSMPVILGTNRDENKTFMALDPAYVEPVFQIKDKQRYERHANYFAQQWKVHGVDRYAQRLSQNEEQVFAYRFDWDNLPDLGLVDLSELIGAGHGLEIPFVFGDLKSDFFLDLLFGFEGKQERQALSRLMLSYWVNFAYSGSPNTGRFENVPEWKAWNPKPNTDKFIILDADIQAISMSSENITHDSLKQLLAEDTNIISEVERCLLFRKMFIPKDMSEFKVEQFPEFSDNCLSGKHR